LWRSCTSTRAIAAKIGPTTSEDAPTGVGTTAIGVAALRAAESERPDRLFEDPLARAFVSGAGWPRVGIEDVEPERRAGLIALATWVTARTRFLDDLLLDAAARGVRQVVLLGAGLDARAFRLDWPSHTRLFELDTPEILGFKERVLDEARAQPRCARVVIPIDLRKDWPATLRAAGFDAAPAAWVAEGLLVYLEEDAVERVLSDIGALSAPGSRIGITASTGASIDDLRRSVGEGVSSLWVSAPPSDPVAWMAEHDWTATVTEARDLLTAHGRAFPEPDPARRPAWLIDGRR
jgi:methyltransferase (TIGR00027 family)